MVEHARHRAAPTAMHLRASMECGDRSCAAREQRFTGTEREHLVLGKRWSNIRRINYGVDEAIATLELPGRVRGRPRAVCAAPRHAGRRHRVCAAAHPRLRSARADFYVPASYTRLRARGTVPQRCQLTPRYIPSDDKDIAAFDVTILDENGQAVVEIEEFVMMRVSDKGRMASDSTEDRKPVIHVDTPAEDAAPAMSLEDAITPAEGVEVFRRALAGDAIADRRFPQDLGRHLEYICAPKAGARGEPQESTANLAEIEAVLATHEAVRQGIVPAWRSRRHVAPLAAYVIYDENTHATVSELRRFLRERLPEDMVPQHFDDDELPLTSDGKIDRASLPNPLGPATTRVAPRTPMERTVATIWQELRHGA